MSLGRPTPRLAVAALLLTATAAGAGTAQAADPVTGTTTLVVQVPALIGQLTLATGATSVQPKVERQPDGTLRVSATLPEVSISDSRAHKPGWSYSVAMPATLVSATNSSVAVAHSQAAVELPSTPVLDTLFAQTTGVSRKPGPQTFENGRVSGLVVAAAGALTTNAAFAPQLSFALPSDTTAGQYTAVVTHSVV